MIAFLHGAPAFGAVENYVVDVVRGLADRRSALIYPDVPALEPFTTLPVEHVPIAADVVAGSTPRLIVELVRTLRRLHPDIVHVTDVWPAAMIAARLARVPRVIVTHHTPELPRHDNLMGRIWWKLAWLTCPETVYTSERDRQRDGRRRGRTHVVYYGIDFTRWRNAAHAIEHDGPIVGTAARLVEQKGLPLLVDAAPEILNRDPSTLFVIVGDGEERPHLERLIRARGLDKSFLFTGARTDVERYVSSFDIYVLPSYFEGLCYAVIEAQVAGVPVVATPVGGVAENVIDGVTGKRMAVGDAASLAESVIWMLDHPSEASKLAEEAQQRAGERYAKERMITETLALYEPRRG